MNLAGFTINIMTLLAMSLCVGLLIDDAIVVRENIFRHIEAGESPWKAALLGTKEVNLAVIATSAVVIAVFLPVGFLSGTVGTFLAQFGLTMCFAMIISLFDALTIAPMLSAYFAGSGGHGKGSSGFSKGGALVGAVAVSIVGTVMGGKHGAGIGAILGLAFGGFASMGVEPFDRFQTMLEKRYHGLVSWVVDHRRRTLSVALIIFIGGLVVAALGITKTFIPASDSTEFGVWMEMPEGTSLQRTGDEALKIDALFRGNNDIQVTDVTVQANKAAWFIGLKPGSERKMTSQELKGYFRDILNKQFPDDKPSVGDIDVGGTDQKPFTLVLKGDDLPALSAYANDLIKEFKAKDPGVVDLDSSYRAGKPEFQVKLDPAKAGRWVSPRSARAWSCGT